jgi:hypothetical protein
MSVSSSGAIATTGNVAGTASYASNAELLDGLDSTVFTLTSSFAAQTASFTAFTASVNSFTASQNILNGTYATTGSNTFTGIQTVNSNLIVTGSITAQTLVVQTITSSVDFVTGSTRFGSILGNTHVFSGSVTMNPGGLFVSSSGNVGIGTTNPATYSGYTTLAINNATNGAVLDFLSNGTRVASINNGGASFDIETKTATPMVFGTNNTERMRITSGGDLQVTGSAIFSSSVTINSSSVLKLGNGNNASTIQIWNSESGAANNFLIYDNSASAYRFVISSTGNVGVGTSSPAALLETRVAGESPATGRVALIAATSNGINDIFRWFDGATQLGVFKNSGQVGIGTDSPSNILTIKNNSGGTNGIDFQSYASTSVQAQITHNQADDSFNIVNTSAFAAGGIAFKTSTTEKVRILTNGNVGIGDNNPGELLVLKKATYPTIKLIETTDNFSGYLQYHSEANEFRLLTITNHPLIFSTNDIERMRIKNTQVIIGSTSNNAEGRLNVSGDSAGNSNNVRLEFSTAQTYGYFQCADRVNVATKRLYIDSADLYINYLGTGTVYSNGSVLTNTNPSDSRLKENITDIAFGLNEILQLRPVEYNWINDKSNQGKQYGFIAQEVQPIIPSLVKEFTIPASELESTEEMIRLGLEKDGIYVGLVKAIQELNTKLDAANVEIEALKAR